MPIDVNKMPRLGFGLMRLPQKDGKIDHEQVCRMVDAYMAAGLNYFDTAYVYHGGLSEVEIREALIKRYPRDAYTITDKLSLFMTRGEEDFPGFFQAQLERLRRSAEADDDQAIVDGLMGIVKTYHPNRDMLGD